VRTIQQKEQELSERDLYNLTTTVFEDKHKKIEEKKEENPFTGIFPVQNPRFKNLNRKKHLNLDLKIDYADQLLDIEDSGDYMEEYGIEDKSNFISPHIHYDSIINGGNFLYNESAYTNYRDITRYARRRIFADGYGPEIKGLEFDWADVMEEEELKILERMEFLKFDDLMNIVSGKISDQELHQILFDERKIKTTDEMTDFLDNLLVQLEEQRKQKEEEEFKKMREQRKRESRLKKGFGPMFLRAINQKKEVIGLTRSQTKKMQTQFNRFVKQINLKGFSLEQSNRTTSNQRSDDTFMSNVPFGKSKEMRDELVTEIDQKIDDRYVFSLNLSLEFKN
jgi:hypothetical protein